MTEGWLDPGEKGKILIISWCKLECYIYQHTQVHRWGKNKIPISKDYTKKQVIPKTWLTHLK